MIEKCTGRKENLGKRFVKEVINIGNKKGVKTYGREVDGKVNEESIYFKEAGLDCARKAYGVRISGTKKG